MDRQDPFVDCEKFNCILPKIDWTKNDTKKVQKYQNMACIASQSPNLFEKKLNNRLLQIKKDHKSNPDDNGERLDEICGGK
jgi:hypothetical protein